MAVAPGFLPLLALLLLVGTASTFIQVDGKPRKIGLDSTRLEIIHIDHTSSPFRRKWESNVERMDAYLRQSLRRYAYIFKTLNSKINPHTVSFATANKYQNIQINLLSSYDNFLGYIVPVLVGSKSLKQYLLLDTFSQFTLIQAQDCITCFNQPNTAYSFSESSSSAPIGCNNNICLKASIPTNCLENFCTFSENVIGMNFSGLLVTDKFTFTNVNSTLTQSLPFGYVSNSKGFSGSVDGIGSFSLTNYSIPSQLSVKTGRNAFSTCFNLASSTEPSKLIIGKNALAVSNVTYTPIARNPYFPSSYFLNVVSVYVGTKKASIAASAFTFSKSNPSRGTLIETGYTFLGFSKAVYTPVLYMVKNILKAKKLKTTTNIGYYSPCYSLSIFDQYQLNDYFPTITLVLANQSRLRFYGYQYTSLLSSGVVCSLIQPLNDTTIIGSLALQNTLTVFDVQANRIGFKSMDCETGDIL